MRVFKTIAVILLLIISVSLCAQEEGGAYVYKKPRVLFNTNGFSSYANFSNLVSINNPSGYGTFADMARADGFICSQQNITAITPALLKNYDILVLPLPYALTAAESTALKDFIKAGGGLLLMADPIDKYPPLNAWIKFLTDYGIGFVSKNPAITSMAINQNGPLARAWPAANLHIPIKDSQTMPYNWASVNLRVDKKLAQACAGNGNKIFAAVSTTHNRGKGRIVVLGDWMLFNSGVEAQGIPINMKDNLFFSRNVLLYLQGAGDLTATSVAPGKTEYAVGQKLKAKIKLTNIGTQSSFGVFGDVYLSKKKYLHAKTNKKVLLGQITINAIHPNLKRTINFKKAVPSGTKAGKYYLIVEIDPTANRDEIYYDNNITRSKKKIKITE